MLKLNNNFGNSQHSTIFLKRCFLKQGLPQFDPPPTHTHTPQGKTKYVDYLA